jgi:peptidoglycan hydrolase CwlO-like protein
MTRSNLVAAVVSAVVASVICVSVSQAVNPVGAIASATPHVHVTSSVVHDFSQTDAVIAHLTAALGVIGDQTATSGQVTALTKKVDTLTNKVNALTSTVNSVNSTANSVNSTANSVNSKIDTANSTIIGVNGAINNLTPIVKSTAERLLATCYQVNFTDRYNELAGQQLQTFYATREAVDQCYSFASGGYQLPVNADDLYTSPVPAPYK